MKTRIVILAALCALAPCAGGQSLEDGFRDPPDSVKPWVFWFWINGNISREGITKDLEAMKDVGIGGALWMEVSGPWWAPPGPIEGGSEEWHDAMQWAITEADRLGIALGLSIDFGYGSGGPHITPDISMQKLVWSERQVKGGQAVRIALPKPAVETQPHKVWLRPGESLSPVVTKALEEVDSYRDVAVFAVPASGRNGARLFPEAAKKKAGQALKTVPGIPGVAEDPLKAYDGRGWFTHLPPLDANPNLSPLKPATVIDLTGKMEATGELRWMAPEGSWSVIRLGHATNVKMTRPCPAPVLGLECDRLHPRGVDAHFAERLRPILEGAGDKAGRTLQFIHIDSWEAYGQNWTTGFADEFRKRRGYDPRPWLPVMTGLAVDSPEMTKRFLWDLRQTVNEVTLANYIDRLRERIAPYGVGFSCEPYGRLCVNSLDYAARGDFVIGEFWTERKIEKPFPTFGAYWYQSMKGLASVANTHGKTRVGAEAFTGSRGWVDHPYLIKGMGDEAFSEGVNHFVIHLSAHQAYDGMKPGLTHRKWGQHFNRHQTWWDFSKPWFEYVARSQFLLQEGRRVADVACLYHEGAPLNFNNVEFALPEGYDHDLCSAEIVRQMEVRDGRIHLPSGASYRYLVLPRSGQLTLGTARKVDELRLAGASIYQQSRITGTPGLEGYPAADRQVRALAANWPMLPEGGWDEVFANDQVAADFEGGALRWLHRRTGDAEIYFVANITPKPTVQTCVFRAPGKVAELWDAESGAIVSLPVTRGDDGRVRAELKFEPAQSWFVVFRDDASGERSDGDPFPTWMEAQAVAADWTVHFDPDWGPQKPVAFAALDSWSAHPDPLLKYYSGTATYRTVVDVPAALAARSGLALDLGTVEVVARVRLNGEDCGVAWKPPYRVDIGGAVRPGRNELEIEVANTWVNRMIGDEHLPLDADWKDWETLVDWPEWFEKGKKSPTGRFTLTTGRHYTKKSPLMPSGLLGPVRILTR